MFVSQDNGSGSILRGVPETLTQRVWLIFIVTGLVASWCILDSWNHDMSSHLFQLSSAKSFIAHTSGQVEKEMDVASWNPTGPFAYTLTLCFLQFAFLGCVFLAFFAARAASTGKSVSESLAPLRHSMSDNRWPVLVMTHIFGSVLLQSLMMPAQMMSLSLFAATRAVEVPVAAVTRSRVFGPRVEGPSKRTSMLMFAAAWLLFFSYTQIAECLCVWSGFGVALSGVPLYFVYALLLTLPASNAVMQESVLVQLQVCPLLMQSVQNLAAAVLFLPILFAAHWLGYEDVQVAAAAIMGHREIYMTVLWLCVQSVFLSAVTVGLITTMDSFWAVATRSLRVVYWWGRQLQIFYLTSNTLLSIARPHASLWSLVMLSGILLGFTAFATDSRQPQAVTEDKSAAEHKSLLND
jgi:hypothetical protein